MFYDRFKQLCDEKGISIYKAATDIGLNRAAANKWKSGSIPNGQTLNKLADYFEVTNDFLLGHEKTPTLTKKDERINISPATISRQVRRINVLGSVPAGIPTEAIEDIIDWEELPEDMFSGGREYFGLRVSGDSMWPDILDGDIVIIRKTPTCDSGSIAVVYVNGYDATLKQVKFGEDGSITLQPKNPNYPPRTYSPKEIEELPVSIAGVVVELRRKWNL